MSGEGVTDSGARRAAPGSSDGAHDVVPFREAARTWGTIALQTFGGPAGQIAVMQRILVDEKRWLGHRRFLHALNYCMLLPGPEAQQLAIYIGWLLNGVRGGLVAGILFVIPGVVALLALSVIYVAYGDTTTVTALFDGVAPAVLAIVVQAVIRVGQRALAHPALVTLAVAAFVSLALFGIAFPGRGRGGGCGRTDTRATRGRMRQAAQAVRTSTMTMRPRPSSPTTRCTPSAQARHERSRCSA